jgi:hypothetical protein
MAITGTWKARQTVESGAMKWGTGINPIHSVHAEGGTRLSENDPAQSLEDVPDEIVGDNHWMSDDYCIQPQQDTSQRTGTYDRPVYGTNTGEFRNTVGDYRPVWGPEINGDLPGGTVVRAKKHGVGDQQIPQQVPSETVTEGWRNKPTGSIEDSHTSDQTQYEMQTSMTQRDKIRNGSQTSGRASEFSAPIASRIIGQRIKMWSGGQRHRDMFPQQQYPTIRAWWNRSAGIGNPDAMQVNSAYESIPLTRDVPSDPDQGQTVPTADNYGYQEEDMIPYA